MGTTKPTILAPHEHPGPDIAYLSELGHTGQVAGVAKAVDGHDATVRGAFTAISWRPKCLAHNH